MHKNSQIDNGCHSGCHCEHNHKEEVFVAGGCTCCGEKKKRGNADNIMLILGIALFVISFFVNNQIGNILLILAYIISGYDVVIKAISGIFKKSFFDECFLMTVATLSALFLNEFYEASAVIILYKIGEMMEKRAVDNSQNALNKVMDIRPDFAYVLQSENFVKTDADKVEVGNIIRVLPGERIPLDGEIITGSTFLDTSSISGEAVPYEKGVGDVVLSGSINCNGVIKVKVTKEFEASTASRIIKAMKEATENKAKTERFITRFSKIYTPIILILAILTGFFVPLLFGFEFKSWIYKACVILVVSCPCALVISIPLSFYQSVGRAAKKGILLKNTSVIERLSYVEAIAFDKTGTLTEGVFEVTKVENKCTIDEFSKLILYAEHFSNHPIARAIRKWGDEDVDEKKIIDYKEEKGKGVIVKLENGDIVAGNRGFLIENGISLPDEEIAATCVYLGFCGEYKGYIVISDKPRKTNVINKINKMGIDAYILTGDNRLSCEEIKKEFGISKVYSELLPEHKVGIIKEISKLKTCAFVGDGINDAPVLATADVGIAMGDNGADAAVEAADIVLMTDNLEKIPELLKIAKETMKIVNQNIILSVGIKLLAVVLGFFGLVNMWFAVFADVGVAIIVILNSVKKLKT